MLNNGKFQKTLTNFIQAKRNNMLKYLLKIKFKYKTTFTRLYYKHNKVNMNALFKVVIDRE